MHMDRPIHKGSSGRPRMGGLGILQQRKHQKPKPNGRERTNMMDNAQQKITKAAVGRTDGGS